MSKKARLAQITAALTLVLVLLLSACGGGGTSSSSAPPPADTGSTADTDSQAADSQTEPAAELEKVKLTGYLLGEEPPDGPAVVEAINEKLEKDINATIEIKYISIADMATQYPLILLSSGQDFDFIISAGFVNYAENAAKGGFAEITTDMVQEYMPLTEAAMPESGWTDTYVNGKIYMIPMTFKNIVTNAAIYRADVGAPAIESVEGFETYFKAVKDGDAGMAPVGGTAEELAQLFTTYLYSKAGYGYSGRAGYGGGFFVGNWTIEDPEYNIVGLFDEEYLEPYREAAVWAKNLYDTGIIPEVPFAEKTTASELFRAGQIAYKPASIENYPQTVTECPADWELGCLPIFTPSGITPLGSYAGQGISFPAGGKNLERAMMAIDLITQDKEYNWLASFGIEGKNYVINDEGVLELPPEIDAENNPYALLAGGWWMANRDLWPTMASQTPEYLALRDKAKEVGVSYLLEGFNPDLESVKTEVANVTNVQQQYELPLRLGMVADVDAAIAELQEKLQAAGYEKVMDVLREQAAQFVSEHS